jgi:hypothetical protein
MRLSEFNYKHAPDFPRYSPRYETPAKRFEELGINEAFPYFESWIYHGAFNLPQNKLIMYEQAFHLINSVLPPEVIETYHSLPTLYRAMIFSSKQVLDIFNGGLPIQNRIMAWAPREVANRYIPFGYRRSWVMLRHTPKESEVIISLNRPTLEFLHVPTDRYRMVVNPGETILSLPLITITPEVVHSHQV